MSAIPVTVQETRTIAIGARIYEIRRREIVPDLADLRAEVAYQRAIPPWCRLQTAREHQEMLYCWGIGSERVQRRGRGYCFECEFHDREAGKNRRSASNEKRNPRQEVHVLWRYYFAP